MHTYSESVLTRYFFIRFVVAPISAVTMLAIALLCVIGLSYTHQLKTVKVHIVKTTVQQHYDQLLSTPTASFERLSDILISSGHVKSIALLDRNKTIIDSAGDLLMRVDLEKKTTTMLPIYKRIDTKSTPVFFIASVITPNELSSNIQTYLYLSYAAALVIFFIALLYQLYQFNSRLAEPFREIYKILDHTLSAHLGPPPRSEKRDIILSYIEDIKKAFDKKKSENDESRSKKEPDTITKKQQSDQTLLENRSNNALLIKIEKELKSPINTILGRIEILKKSGNVSSKEHFSAIAQAAEALLTINNSLFSHFNPELEPAGMADNQYQPSEKYEGGSYQALLVDDNPANLKLLDALLKRLNIQCDLTENGLAALEALAKKTYDIVLMDLNMPEMDGIEAVSTYRKTESDHQRTPIIAVSASTVEEQKKNLLTAGFDDYLSKPISETMLRITLQRWLEKNSSTPGAPILTIENDPAPNVPHTSINAAQAQSEETIVVDKALSLMRANNNAELAKDMLAMLIDMLPASLDNIEQHFDTQNYELLGEQAHKIHGGACYCGSIALQRSSGELDMLIKQGAQADQSKIKILTITLMSDIKNLIEWGKSHDIHHFFQ